MNAGRGADSLLPVSAEVTPEIVGAPPCAGVQRYVAPHR
jgi:hypothetical protein